MFASQSGVTNKHILGNGLTVLIKPTDNEGLAAVYLKIKAGVSSENEYAGTGITHFIEHMVFKGTPETEVGELAKNIKSYGGYINATTTLDTTTYFVIIPKEHLVEAINILSDAVMNPDFDEDEVEKERAVILNEVKLREDDPSSKVIRLLFESAYLSHPYRFPILGYEDLLKGLKRKDLAEYHRKYYTPNNSVLSIAGDIDAEEVLYEVKEVFARYPRRNFPVVSAQEEPEQIIERVSIHPAEINLGYFCIGFHSTGLLDGDIYPLDVFANIFGQGDNSRLNKVLVKEKRLLYSVSSFNYTPLYPGLFIISGVGNPENLKEAVDVIMQEIQIVKEKGVSGKEFERAKANAYTGYLKGLETVDSQASSMAQGQVFAGDPEFSRKYVDGIKGVTLPDITRVVNKYLTDNNASIVYLVPNSKSAELTEQISDKALIDGVAGESKEAIIYTLDNGMRLILKEEHRLPLISVTLVCMGGLRAEPRGNSGKCNIMASLLLKGTKNRKESEIKGALEGLGGGISSFSGMNSFGLTLEFVSKDSGFVFDILEDVVKNPVFPEDELEKIKEITIAQIEMEEDSVFQKGILNLRREIFKGHPYENRVSGDEGYIKGIGIAEVKEFYQKVLNPGNIVISCVGDFDSDKLYEDLRARFSGIKNNGYKVVPYSYEASDIQTEQVFLMPKKEALVLVGFKGVDIKSEDRYILSVITKTMSGQGSRLFDAIREKEGLSYSQGAESVEGLDPGYIFFYVATNKQDIETVKNILEAEISKMKTEAVSDVELSDAKNSLIGTHAISMQSNNAKSFAMAIDELYGLGYDNYRHYKENIEKHTKDDIIRVTDEYFDLDEAFFVTIVPEEEPEE